MLVGSVAYGMPLLAAYTLQAQGTSPSPASANQAMAMSKCSSSDGRTWRSSTEIELTKVYEAVVKTVRTQEGTAAANQAMIAARNRSTCTIMVVGVLGAGKTQLIASILRGGSREQEIAFSRVTHDKPARHPMGMTREQTYTVHCSDARLSTLLKFVDTPGVEPGLGAESLQDNLAERMFPEEAAASVDQVWLCVSVDSPKVLNADKVQALVLQLEQAGLPTIVVLTKSDGLLFKETVTETDAEERSHIDNIMQGLTSRFSVIKDYVCVSTWRSPSYISRAQCGCLRFPEALNTLLLATMDHLEESKLAAFARYTAVTLDTKMAASAKAILHGIRWHSVFVVCQPVPIIPELVGVPYLLQKTFSRVFAVWGMDDACQAIVLKQLLNSSLIWKMARCGLVKTLLCSVSLGAAFLIAGPAAQAAAVGVVAAVGQAVDLCSLILDTIQLGLMQTGVLVQLSKLTGGNNSILSADPLAAKKVMAALKAYKTGYHARITKFCGKIMLRPLLAEYRVYTVAQIEELQQKLHTFLREMVQDCTTSQSHHTITIQP